MSNNTTLYVLLLSDREATSRYKNGVYGMENVEPSTGAREMSVIYQKLHNKVHQLCYTDRYIVHIRSI